MFLSAGLAGKADSLVESVGQIYITQSVRPMLVEEIVFKCQKSCS